MENSNVNQPRCDIGEEKEEVSMVPALVRGMNILEMLAERTGGYTFGELLANSGIPKPSLFRILQELQKRGYVRQDPDTKKYFLGFKILNLGSTILRELDLRTQARSFLQQLAKETAETTELVIFTDGDILHIDKIENPQSIQILAQIGSRYSTLHASAHGQIFLAFIREAEREKVLRRDLKKITENTITDIQELRKRLDQIRKDGFAFDFGEGRIDVSRCTAPVYNHLGEIIASVGIAGPVFRMGLDKKEEFGQKVKQIALEISKAMGWPAK